MAVTVGPIIPQLEADLTAKLVLAWRTEPCQTPMQELNPDFSLHSLSVQSYGKGILPSFWGDQHRGPERRTHRLPGSPTPSDSPALKSTEDQVATALVPVQIMT